MCRHVSSGKRKEAEDRDARLGVERYIRARWSRAIYIPGPEHFTCTEYFHSPDLANPLTGAFPQVYTRASLYANAAGPLWELARGFCRLAAGERLESDFNVLLLSPSPFSLLPPRREGGRERNAGRMLIIKVVVMRKAGSSATDFDIVLAQCLTFTFYCGRPHFHCAASSQRKQRQNLDEKRRMSCVKYISSQLRIPRMTRKVPSKQFHLSQLSFHQFLQLKFIIEVKCIRNQL